MRFGQQRQWHPILSIELAEELNRKKEHKHIVKCRRYGDVCVCVSVCNKGQHEEAGERESQVLQSRMTDFELCSKHFVAQFMWTNSVKYSTDTSTLPTCTYSPVMWTCRLQEIDIANWELPVNFDSLRTISNRWEMFLNPFSSILSPTLPNVCSCIAA